MPEMKTEPVWRDRSVERAMTVEDRLQALEEEVSKLLRLVEHIRGVAPQLIETLKWLLRI